MCGNARPRASAAAGALCLWAFMFISPNQSSRRAKGPVVSPPPVHAWLAQRGACLALLGLGQTWPAQHNGWGCSLCTCAGTAVQAAQQPVLGTTSAAPWVAHTPVQLCGAVFRARACACVRMSSCLCGYVCLPVCPSSAVLERACARARVRVCVCVCACARPVQEGVYVCACVLACKFWAV